MISMSSCALSLTIYDYWWTGYIAASDDTPSVCVICLFIDYDAMMTNLLFN